MLWRSEHRARYTLPMLRLAGFLLVAASMACSDGPHLNQTPVAMGNTCLAVRAGANQTLTIRLPAAMVQVHGTVGGNVTSMEFQSALTGVRYYATIDSTGSFTRSLPAGKYTVDLKHAAKDFQNERPAKPLDVPLGLDRFDFMPCTGTDCVVAAAMLVLRSTDPTQSGRLSGKIVLASGATAAPTGINQYVGRVDLVPLVAGEGDPWYGKIFGPDMTFEFTNVAYGKYKLVFKSQLGARFEEKVEQTILTAHPIGQWTFADTIEINQPNTQWQGTLPAQAVRLRIQVNGQPMGNNGVGGDSRGNLVIRDVTGQDIDYLPLGPTGPVDFNILMIPGSYQIGLESFLAVGHGLLKRREQDVLPTGAGTLGSLDVAAAAAPIEATFNASVRGALFKVAVAEPGKMALDLKSGNGTYAWANLITQTQTPTLLYAGCQAADQGTTAGPTTSGFGIVYESSFGEFCVPCP